MTQRLGISYGLSWRGEGLALVLRRRVTGGGFERPGQVRLAGETTGDSYDGESQAGCKPASGALNPRLGHKRLWGFPRRSLESPHEMKLAHAQMLGEFIDGQLLVDATFDVLGDAFQSSRASRR